MLSSPTAFELGNLKKTHTAKLQISSNHNDRVIMLQWRGQGLILCVLNALERSKEGGQSSFLETRSNVLEKQ